MLSDEIVNKLSERFVRRIENLNTYIIKQIGETIKRISKLSYSQAMQLESVLKLITDILYMQSDVVSFLSFFTFVFPS